MPLQAPPGPYVDPPQAASVTSERLRVLNVSRQTGGGGAEKLAMSLVEGLVGRGHEAWLAVGIRDADHPLRILEIFRSAASNPVSRQLFSAAAASLAAHVQDPQPLASDRGGLRRIDILGPEALGAALRSA